MAGPRRQGARKVTVQINADVPFYEMELPDAPLRAWDGGEEDLVLVLLLFPSAPYGYPKRVPAYLNPNLTIRDLRLLLADTIGLSFHEQLLYGSDNVMLKDEQTIAVTDAIPPIITVLQDASLIARPPPTLSDAGPVLHAIRPTQGSTHGGTRVELIGERLRSGASGHVPVCRFGAQYLPVTVKGEAAYVVSPPHAPGPASVEISPDGVHWSHSGVRFLYIDPRAESDHGIAIRAPARSCYSNEVHRVGLQASSISRWRPDDPGGCV